MPGQAAYRRIEKGRRPEVAARGCLPIRFLEVNIPTYPTGGHSSLQKLSAPSSSDRLCGHPQHIFPRRSGFHGPAGCESELALTQRCCGSGTTSCPLWALVSCKAHWARLQGNRPYPGSAFRVMLGASMWLQLSTLHLTIAGSSLGLGLAFKAQGLPCSHASLSPSTPVSSLLTTHPVSTSPLCHWARLLLTSHLCSSCCLCRECTPSSHFHHLTNSYALFKTHFGSEMPFLTPLPAPHCVEGAGRGLYCACCHIH